VLKVWFIANQDNPYPSKKQKLLLMDQTGLSNDQLRNWLNNMRKRHWVSLECALLQH
jgi:hypothetical protein